MKTINRCEADIDAIRLKLYEETKNLSPEDRIKRSMENARKLADEFGFVIVPSANQNDNSSSVAENHTPYKSG